MSTEETNSDDWQEKLKGKIHHVCFANNPKSSIKFLSKEITFWEKLAEKFSKELCDNTKRPATLSGIVNYLRNLASNGSWFIDLKIEGVDSESTFDKAKTLLLLLKKPLSDLSVFSGDDSKIGFASEGICYIDPKNIAWLIVLIVNIESNSGKLTFSEFAKIFNQQIKNTSSELVMKPSVQETPTPKDTPIPPKLQWQSLIFVANSQHLECFKNIAVRSANQFPLEESDYDQLYDGCEWVWCGNTAHAPTEFIPDQNGNLCWLRLDLQPSEPIQITTTVAFSDLLDKIKVKKAIIKQVTAGGPFQMATSGLGEKTFTRL